jgi:hypothetical protein
VPGIVDHPACQHHVLPLRVGDRRRAHRSLAPLGVLEMSGRPPRRERSRSPTTALVLAARSAMMLR